MVSRVLVVEDNKIERLCVAAVLTRAGFTVTEAPNGEEAIQRLFKAIPDLIVLDMMLPDLDGWQFLEIRRNNPLLRDVPVVVVTGAAFSTEEWARELGAQAFLKKPFTAEMLIEEIRRLTQQA